MGVRWDRSAPIALHFPGYGLALLTISTS